MTTRAEAYRLLIADVYELAGLSRSTSEDLARQVGQTVARWHVLSVLSGGPQTVPGVARRLGQARQSVQRVADDLVGAGLAFTRPNPGHARSPLLELTRRGSDVLADLTERADRHRARALARAGLRADDMLTARQVLRTVLDALGAVEHRPAGA